MGFYIFLEGLLLIGIVMFNSVQLSKSKSKRNALYFFLVTVLTAIACFRDTTVGTDTRYYIRIFNIIRNEKWSELWSFSQRTGYEMGYVIYNKLLSYISTNGQIVTIGNSLILMVLASRFLHKECRNPVLGLYLFYTLGIYQSSFNIVSSLIAAYIVYSGIDEIRKRRFIKFLFYVVGASLFHTAALLMIVLFFLYQVQINFKRFIEVFGFGAILSPFIVRVLMLLVNIIPSKYVGYISRTSDNGMILVFHLLILFVIFAVQYATTRKIATNDDDIRIHTWAVLLDIILLMIALRINIFTRVAYFFMPALPVFIVKSIEKTNKANNRSVLLLGLVFAIGIQYIIRLCLNNIGGTIPYFFF